MRYYFKAGMGLNDMGGNKWVHADAGHRAVGDVDEFQPCILQLPCRPQYLLRISATRRPHLNADRKIAATQRSAQATLRQQARWRRLSWGGNREGESGSGSTLYGRIGILVQCLSDGRNVNWRCAAAAADYAHSHVGQAAAVLREIVGARRVYQSAVYPRREAGIGYGSQCGTTGVAHPLEDGMGGLRPESAIDPHDVCSRQLQRTADHSRLLPGERSSIFGVGHAGDHRKIRALTAALESNQDFFQ